MSTSYRSALPCRKLVTVCGAGISPPSVATTIIGSTAARAAAGSDREIEALRIRNR